MYVCWYLSVLSFFFDQNQIVALALVHRTLVAHTHTVVPAVNDQRFLMPSAQFLRLRVKRCSCTNISLNRTVCCHRLRYDRERHVAIELRPRHKHVITHGALEGLFLSLLAIPECGDALLAEGVTALERHREFKLFVADRALRVVLHHSPT